MGISVLFVYGCQFARDNPGAVLRTVAPVVLSFALVGGLAWWLLLLPRARRHLAGFPVQRKE